jgi:hypothetical protein
LRWVRGFGPLPLLTASYYPLKRFKRAPWTRLGKAQCAPCPRAKWCLPAPLARHPFASHGPNLGRASRLTHSAPSSSQVSVDHRAPGGRSSYPKALEEASGWRKGARHPPTSPRSNSSVVEPRHHSRAQEQQPVRVAMSVSALSAGTARPRRCPSIWHAARRERVLLDQVRRDSSEDCREHVGASEAPLGSGWEGLLS